MLWTGHHVNIRTHKFKYVPVSTDIFQSKSTKPFWHQLGFALKGQGSFLTHFVLHSLSRAHSVYTHHTYQYPLYAYFVLQLLYRDKALAMLGAPFWKELNTPKVNILVSSLQCRLFAISYQHKNWAPAYHWCHTGYKSCGPALALLFVESACDRLQHQTTFFQPPHTNIWRWDLVS